MYTERFDLGRLEMPADGYRGTTAYARAKRAQVVLSHEWAERWAAEGVASYAVHPGWVDTPGLASGLPAFAKLGPLLRTPVEGADTVVWLAAGEARRRDPALPLTEGFFHDRHRRGEHHLPWTACGATPADGRLLWEWCAARTDATDVPSTRPHPRPSSDVTT
jgi:dehydrogenase/reductase SDR family member 12